MTRTQQRKMLQDLLNLHRCKRYRRGMLQLAVGLDLITQAEWGDLHAMVIAGDKTIVVDKPQPDRPS